LQILVRTLLAATLLAAVGSAQNTFVVTGTAIPADLLKVNYGSLPNSIKAFDLNICNVTAARQPVVSSEIYQALAQSNTALMPIGRQIMLAAILRNQSHSVATVLSVAGSAATGVLSVLGAAKFGVPQGLIAGAAIGSLAGQQLILNLKPVLTADQLEKFENQVLEPALVLDGGSCVERTVFTAVRDSKVKMQGLSFHVR
jgi:hypothetical protein